MTAPVPRPTAADLRRWRNAVFLVFTITGVGMATWVARTPEIRDHLEVSTAQMGLLIFGLAAGSIVGLTLSSHVLHWIGARPAMVSSLSACALGLGIVGVGSSVLESYVVTLIGLVLYGAGAGCGDVVMNVEGAGMERAAARNLMPLFHAFFSVGTVVGAGLGALAAYLGVPIWVHLALIAVVLLVGVIAGVRSFLSGSHGEQHEQGRAGGSTFASRMSIWLEPRTLLIGLIVLGMAFAEGSANDWLALAMVDGRGVDAATGALLFGVFNVAMTVGRVAGVPVLDRFGRVPVLRVSAVLAVAGLLLVINVEHPAVYVAGIVLWGLGASLGFPVGMSAAADDPDRAAARVSAVATIGYFAFLVGPPLIGVLGDHVGLLPALLVVVVLIALAGAASPAARERGARQG